MGPSQQAGREGVGVSAGGARPGAGRPRIPAEERKVTITLRLPADLAGEIKAEAEFWQCPITDVVVRRLNAERSGRVAK